MAVDVDAFPVALRRMVHLMIDAHMGPLLIVAIPPGPPLPMEVVVCECMKAFDGLEVSHDERLVLRLAGVGVEPARHTEEVELVCLGIKIFGHG